jgi:hypothetical protein
VVLAVLRHPPPKSSGTLCIRKVTMCSSYGDAGHYWPQNPAPCRHGTRAEPDESDIVLARAVRVPHSPVSTLRVYVTQVSGRAGSAQCAATGPTPAHPPARTSMPGNIVGHYPCWGMGNDPRCDGRPDDCAGRIRGRRPAVRAGAARP